MDAYWCPWETIITYDRYDCKVPRSRFCRGICASWNEILDHKSIRTLLISLRMVLSK